MDGASVFEVEELDSSLQRVTHRRWAFFMVPVVATSAAGVLVIWEIVRQNLPADMTEHWPWKLRIFDLESGATIVTVLAVFLITRAQYAETVRPVIGWGLRLASPLRRTHTLRRHDDVLELVVFNGGGGVAVVRSFLYRLARNEEAVPSSWVSYEALHRLMGDAGLVSHRDYEFYLVGAGYPLPPGMNKEAALMTGQIRADALLRFRIFDIKIEVRDAVGDIHERILPCRAVVKDPAFRLAASQAERRRPTLRSAVLKTFRDWGVVGRSSS